MGNMSPDARAVDALRWNTSTAETKLDCCTINSVVNTKQKRLNNKLQIEAAHSAQHYGSTGRYK